MRCLLVAEKEAYDISCIGSFYNTFFFEPNLRKDDSLILPGYLCVNHEKLGEWLNKHGKELKKEIRKRERQETRKTKQQVLPLLSLICEKHERDCFDAKEVIEVKAIQGNDGSTMRVETRHDDDLDEETYYNEQGDIIGSFFCDHEIIANAIFLAKENARKEREAVEERLTAIQMRKKSKTIYPVYENIPF